MLFEFDKYLLTDDKRSRLIIDLRGGFLLYNTSINNPGFGTS
ncbi:hypothetical protein SAMN05192573_102171 [Mucilaginibacter gossypii]|uniref:Uncharacterized protein n=1 Tax=Mucilaginibacter gossypii TaxID=551996 RepID=A0A1G7RB87_9SPHI|nr:hypothetical protein SAMN05192573_102171 [Mucilaginibacter gossypii]